ncbi:hypothetical protein ES703_106931 [subsurface metagenome]
MDFTLSVGSGKRLPEPPNIINFGISLLIILLSLSISNILLLSNGKKSSRIDCSNCTSFRIHQTNSCPQSFPDISRIKSPGSVSPNTVATPAICPPIGRKST